MGHYADFFRSGPEVMIHPMNIENIKALSEEIEKVAAGLECPVAEADSAVAKMTAAAERHEAMKGDNPEMLPAELLKARRKAEDEFEVAKIGAERAMASVKAYQAQQMNQLLRYGQMLAPVFQSERERREGLVYCALKELMGTGSPFLRNSPEKSAGWVNCLDRITWERLRAGEDTASNQVLLLEVAIKGLLMPAPEILSK